MLDFNCHKDKTISRGNGKKCGLILGKPLKSIRLSLANAGCRNLLVVSHHDQGNGKEYQHDAQGYSGGEALMEDQHTDKEGGDRLQGSQDRGVCGPDEVDAHRHENQGNDGREQRQSEGTSPLHQPGRNLQVDTSPQPYDVDDEAEQQGIEREFHGREGLQERAVHSHDVDGIAQGGEED